MIWDKLTKESADVFNHKVYQKDIYSSWHSSGRCSDINLCGIISGERLSFLSFVNEARRITECFRQNDERLILLHVDILNL